MIVKVKYEVSEKSVHTRVFIGPELNHLGMCGSLIFNPAEFKFFKGLLEDGCLLTKGAEVIFSDSTGGSSSSYPKVRVPEA